MTMHTFLGSTLIKRELAHWQFEKGALISSIKQRYTGKDETDEPSSRFISYLGIVGSLGDCLFTIDFHRDSGREMSVTTFYPKTRILSRLTGW